MPVSPASALPADVAQPTGFLHTLLAMSLTAVAVLRPLYTENGETIRDFDWVFLNTAGQRMIGQPERPAHSLLALFPTAQADGVFAVCCRAFETGEPGRNQTNYQADGLDGYFLLVAQRYENVLVVNFTDTNDQPRTAVEVALRESRAAEQAARAEAEQQRQRFHEVLMQLPAYVAVYHGPSHVYQFVNPPYQSMFPNRSFAGRPFGEAMPESNELGVVALFDRVYQTGKPFHLPEMEGWFDFKGTGEPEQVFLNLYLQPLRNARGEVDGVLDYSHNVTEQVLARRQVEQLNAELEERVQARTADLQESEGRFRTMADAAPAMLWVTNPDGHCTYLNGQWYAYTGQTEVEALGLGWTLAVHPDDADLAGQQFIAANARREAFSFRYRLRRHDGAYRWAIDTGQPHFTGAGDYAGFVGTVIDIHEQYLAEGELASTNKQLTRTNVDLDTFVYAASHDLKAPIANIEGLLNALREYLPDQARDPMVPRLLAMMQGAIGRFQQTVGHLTDISRLQDAQYDQPVETLDLAQALEDVRLDLLPLLESTRADLSVAVEACPGVRFSAKNLRSVLFNLLSNAIKYRAPGRTPVVRVGARCAPTQLVLEVQDNGLGLNPQQQDQLFTMFRRLHTHVEGSGVGLYLIKRTIENAGGTLTVQSQPGVGSTFTVTLPRA